MRVHPSRQRYELLRTDRFDERKEFSGPTLRALLDHVAEHFAYWP